MPPGYLFAYSRGFSSGELGPPGNFVSNSLYAGFTLRFGSYIHDWADANAQFRLFLAQKPGGLACAPGGGPYNGTYLYYHPLGLGYTAGYCERYTDDSTLTWLWKTNCTLTNYAAACGLPLATNHTRFRSTNCPSNQNRFAGTTGVGSPRRQARIRSLESISSTPHTRNTGRTSRRSPHAAA